MPDEVIDAAVTTLRQQLAAVDEPARRRQVTVLFADVSGFTALSERLDHEVLADLMNELWGRLDTVITELGGRIDKHMGDAVMGVWGVEATREDDPERAVRAALLLQEAVADFRAESGHDVRLRVGVNTGPALLGFVGTTSEHTIMGDTVNVASRLEHIVARWGSAHRPRHLPPCPGCVRRRSRPGRGRARQVGARTGLRRAEGEAARRSVSRLAVSRASRRGTIGREAELERLRDEFEAVRDRRGSRVVTVAGEAGVGKSRLLYELESWLELRPEEVWLLKGRALPSRQHVPLGLMRDVLAERFGLLDSDSLVELAAKIEAGFAGILSEDNAGLVGRFLGFDLDSGSRVSRAVTADQLATAARAHLVSWLDRLTADHPAVMLLEDIHWADSESLALVGELITRLPGARLLVVALTRLDLADRHPEWLEDVHPFRRVDVDRLPAETTALLVREILQHAAHVPDELVDLIADRSDGNPFFIEELIKMLADRDVIRTDEATAGWTIDVDRLGSMGVPATLTAVLQARLDNLAQPDRAVLQSASVVGRVFWDAAVEAIDRRSADHALHVVRAKELVFRRDHSTFDDCNEFIFKHALLRDVTYETVLLADRQRLHSAAATWLSSRAGARMGEFLDTIAEHHRLGGEPALAAACFHRAARTALDRGLAAAARYGVERAIEQWTLVGATVPPDALVILGDACRRLGDLDGADAALEGAIAQATDPAERSEALMRSSRVASERGDQMLERARLEAASEGADALDARTRARLAALMAWWEHRYGDLDIGRQHGERALAIATAAGAANELHDAHTALGGIAVACDDLDAAEEHTRAALELARDERGPRRRGIGARQPRRLPAPARRCHGLAHPLPDCEFALRTGDLTTPRPRRPNRLRVGGAERRPSPSPAR